MSSGRAITDVGRTCGPTLLLVHSGAQFEGDLGDLLALGAKISPFIGLREKWESP